ncbi:MAG: RHS repeat-associated core domain-containing protein, partial [Candidatus Thiodiazotropha endolucinida]
TDGGYTPIERTTRLDYNAAGNLIAIDGPREGVTDQIQFSYDNNQRLSTIALADETTQKVLAYDDYGRPIKIQNGNQTPLTIRYSRWGKPQQIRQGQRTVSYTYDVIGQLASVTEPDGETLNFDYDAAGRAISLRDAEGNSVRKLIDTEDRLLAYSVEGSQGDVLRAAIYLRDANQRLRGVVTPEGIQRMVGYDENGKMTLDTNGGGKGSYFMRTKTGALKAVTDADGGELRKARLANGRITLTQDSLKRIDVMMHDDFGNRIAWRNPDSGLTYYRYDQAGNLVEKRDAAGNTTSYEYDASDRLIRLESPDGITRLRYQAGMLAEVEGPGSRQRYSYDDEGRLVSHSREIDGHRFLTSYAYDPKTGKLISRQLPGGERLSYRYQANQGRLSAVIQSDWLSDQPLLEGVTYEPFGRITGYTHADGGRTEKAYDKSGRLIHQEHTRLGKYKLAYNVAGELILIEKHQQHNRYVYDAAGRLRQADTSTGKKQYRYDALGNRLNQPLGSLKHVSARASASTVSNEAKKDRLGRVTALGQRRWEYNVAGQPVRFYRGERLVAAYRYNHKGERIRKTLYPDDPAQAPEITYYLYDLQQRLSAEADEDGDIFRQYLYLGRTPYAMLKDGVAYSIQSDHLGTPHSVTDEKSRLKWQAEYDPFGRAVIKTQRISFNLRRPGQYEDAESGLYDNYLRRYDPDNGRYLEPDPLGNLDGMNRYAYVGNRPLERTDPLGLFKVSTSLGGDPVHESILQIAFNRFNQEYAFTHGGRVAFSQHTINLFIYANIRTDLIISDDEHQYAFYNHFDNPTDGPLNDGNADWFTQTLQVIEDRRGLYGSINGEIRTDVCSPPGFEPIRENPDIRDIVENFGQNSHTLADFYAHSNWVDEVSRGGYYRQEVDDPDFPGFSRVIVEEGTVPNGLAMTTVWDETVAGYNLYSGQVDGFSDIFGNPIYGETRDIFGNVDKSTHAYWEKDALPSTDDPAAVYRFEMARNLAIEHTLQEIRNLWDESANNLQLRGIYAMDRAGKESEGVQYSLEGCALCPGLLLSDFEDIDNQIDYVADFINEQN